MLGELLVLSEVGEPGWAGGTAACLHACMPASPDVCLPACLPSPLRPCSTAATKCLSSCSRRTSSG